MEWFSRCGNELIRAIARDCCNWCATMLTTGCVRLHSFHSRSCQWVLTKCVRFIPLGNCIVYCRALTMIFNVIFPSRGKCSYIIWNLKNTGFVKSMVWYIKSNRSQSFSAAEHLSAALDSLELNELAQSVHGLQRHPWRFRRHLLILCPLHPRTHVPAG